MPTKRERTRRAKGATALPMPVLIYQGMLPSGTTKAAKLKNPDTNPAVWKSPGMPQHESGKERGKIEDMVHQPPRRCRLGADGDFHARILKREAEGDIIGTALSHTDWLDSLAMKEALGASEFSLSELKTGLCTVYLVLPPKYLDEHARFLRLFVNLALQEAAKGRKARYPILMVLDEFYALGPLQFVAKAAGLLAGYGVKLWPIVQNLGQIGELYPDNWETFLGNAGLWQVFAVNDQTTARYMSERLGEHIVWRKQRTFNQETQKYEEEWMPQGASFLRTDIELGREVSRDSGNQVIFVEGGDSFLLRRRPYDKTFKREQYSPDPSEPSRSPWLDRFQLPDFKAAWESWVDSKGQQFDDWWEKRQERKAGKR
jgi:type IV secretory pathway TraG/TraD family ATPase VirD4